MKKILTILGLLGFLSQPALAQYYSSGTPVYSIGNSNQYNLIPDCPTAIPTGMAVPIASPCPTACPIPTGGAAPMNQVMIPVNIPKKHWWEKNKTEYRPVYLTPTGGAAPAFPASCPVQPVCPTSAPAYTIIYPLPR